MFLQTSTNTALNVAKSKLKMWGESFKRLTTTSKNFVLWLHVSQTRFEVIFWSCTVIKVNLGNASGIDEQNEYLCEWRDFWPEVSSPSCNYCITRIFWWKWDLIFLVLPWNWKQINCEGQSSKLTGKFNFTITLYQQAWACSSLRKTMKVATTLPEGVQLPQPFLHEDAVTLTNASKSFWINDHRAKRKGSQYSLW